MSRTRSTKLKVILVTLSAFRRGDVPGRETILLPGADPCPTQTDSAHWRSVQLPGGDLIANR